MNPLEKLKNWYESLDSEMQLEIAALTGHFHLDQTINYEFAADKKISKFKNYLDSSSLNYIEIIQRTLFIIKLTSFSIDGRSTEADWSQTVDRHLDLINAAKKDNRSLDFIDNMLNKLPERKAIWIKFCSEWNSFINNELSDKAIAEWYFIGLAKKMK